MSVSAAEPDVTPLFATPLTITALDDRAELCRSLASALIDQRSRDGGPDRRRKGEAWTATGYERSSDPAVKRLIERSLDLVRRSTLDATGEPARRDWRVEVAACVAEAGETAKVKTHPAAFWAGLFLVQDGYGGSKDQTLGGELVLEDPRLPITILEAPGVQLLTQLRPYPIAYDPEAVIRPSSGHLLLFPAWVRAGFRLYQGEEARISLSLSFIALKDS